MGSPEGMGDPQAEIARLQAELATLAATARVERDRLTHELGHRVKNMLSMAQAVANQTFRDVPDSGRAIDAFNERILALAAASDLILKLSWTTATLDAVAACVVRPPDPTAGSLSIDGPPLRISAGAALSFAMALHELATNARRCGGWSQPGGAVALCWHIAEGEDGAKLDLDWTETGGPPAEAPSQRGFGLRLAEQSLRSAFGRDVRFTFAPSGLACHVRAPIASLTV